MLITLLENMVKFLELYSSAFSCYLLYIFILFLESASLFV